MFAKQKDGRVKSEFSGNFYKGYEEAEYNEPKCHTCDTRTMRNSYDQPDGFLRHYSKLWQEQYNAGVWLCPKCKKAQLMREAKEIKRRAEAGEDVRHFEKGFKSEVRLTIGG